MDIMLSKHFSLVEMTRSDYALRKGLDNTPDPAEVQELRLLCQNILEPLRDLLGVPIHINSGFRSIAVNSGIGGVPTSQHCKGQAADLVVPGVSNRKIIDTVRASAIPYDQLIYEGGEDGWIHISRTNFIPRRQVLAADFSTGSAVYSKL